jgi:hypothetical protein
MRLCWVLIVVGLFLSACQTAGGNQAVAPGVGPVKMTERSYKSFQSYLTSKDPIAFALSENGKTSSWYYCIEFGCRPYRTIHLAITQCNLRSNGSPCHLFARQRDVVWESPGDWKPLSAGEPVAGEDLYGKSLTDVAETRLYGQYNLSIVGQKAFAAARATDGKLVAVGSAIDRLTVRSAIEEALRACHTARPGDSVNCGIVEINNDLVDDIPTPTLFRNADRYVSTALPNERQMITLLVDWDDVAPAVTADLTYYVPKKQGSFFLRLAEGPGLCRGTLDFANEIDAAWTMTCAGDLRAEGTMSRISPDPVYEGKGLDGEGRQIRFLSVRPQS